MADTQIAKIKDYLWPIDCIFQFRNLNHIANFPAKAFGGEWTMLDQTLINHHLVETWKRTG